MDDKDESRSLTPRSTRSDHNLSEIAWKSEANSSPSFTVPSSKVMDCLNPLFRDVIDKIHLMHEEQQPAEGENGPPEHLQRTGEEKKNQRAKDSIT